MIQDIIVEMLRLSIFGTSGFRGSGLREYQETPQAFIKLIKLPFC